MWAHWVHYKIPFIFKELSHLLNGKQTAKKDNPCNYIFVFVIKLQLSGLNTLGKLF